MKKIATAALSILFTFALTCTAQEYKEGVNYFPLKISQPTQTGEKVEVLELFWYRCPHCYELEPYLAQWQKNKPEFVEFVRFPAVLNRSWEFDARVFYTFAALGLIDELHEKYFNAIHSERKRITSLEQLANWVDSQGLNSQPIVDAFNSFGVNSMVSRAIDLSSRYDTDGVPTIIVDGKYRTKVSLAGGQNEIIDLINYLALRAQSERQN
tara:strand:+ start:245 stop:877 length:633 start_codon:yes stop_codon:yes gene_type:complete